MEHLTDSSFLLQKQKEEEKVPVTKEDVDYVKRVFEDGKRQMRNGKWELAVESFSKAIKKYRKNPVFYLKRAKCYLKLKKGREAEADCTKALSLDSKLLKAKFQRSRARELMGNYRGACLDLQDIIILDPSNQTAKEELDRLKPNYQNKLRQEGYNIFNDEEKEEVGEEEENKSLIIGTLTGNDRSSEENDMGEIISRANQEKEKGNKFVKEGKWEEAKEAYSKAINLNPEDAIFYANRALCHLKTKNEHRAVLDCSMALKKNPRYVKAYMRRAVARKETGDLWGARSDVKQTLLLEPNNTQAKGFLEELNVLLEQKVYQDFQHLAGESSQSEEEMETTIEMEYCQQEMNKIKDEQVVSSNANENSVKEEKPKSQAEFKYVFPVNKSPKDRSKKPLRRVPIKFTDLEVGNQMPEVRKNEENLPEWICNPSATTRENAQETLKRSSSKITSQSKENKRSHKARGRECSDENESFIEKSSDNKDFKYVFPVNKKPHQRSKKPLVRIPIKFTV